MSGEKAKVFVGTSGKSSGIATSIQANLENIFLVDIWTQNVFPATSTILSALIKKSDAVDFAIFVLAADDTSEVNGVSRSTTRDNVIFELGLFIGSIGVNRCFVLVPSDAPDLHQLSDYSGYKCISYHPERLQDNLKAATSTACEEVQRLINELGPIRFANAKNTEYILEAACRALSCPSSPDRTTLRAFLFAKNGGVLTCVSHYAANKVEEPVGNLHFTLDGTLDDLTVVSAFKKKTFIRSALSKPEQEQHHRKLAVSEKLKMVVAAPIVIDGKVWGVIDFDVSGPRGLKLLDSDSIGSAVYIFAKQIAKILGEN